MSGRYTEALSDLKRQLTDETTLARTLDAKAEAAAAELAAARDAVVAAYADQDDAAVRKASSARDKAEARVAELADRQAAAQIRVQRAKQAAQTYETEHAVDLIAELKPAATEAVEAVQHHAAELVAADRRWRNVSAEVSRLLQHVATTAPRDNARGEHNLSSTIKTLRQARAIESPMPTGSENATTRQSNTTAASGDPSAAASAANLPSPWPCLRPPRWSLAGLGCCLMRRWVLSCSARQALTPAPTLIHWPSPSPPGSRG